MHAARAGGASCATRPPTTRSPACPNRRAFRGAAGARDRAAARASRWCCATWTTSRPSTTPTATTPATSALQLLAGRAAQPAAPQRRGLPDRRRRVRDRAARGQPARRRARDAAACARRCAAARPRAATRSRRASASRCSSPATIPSGSSHAPTRRSTRPSAGARRAWPERLRPQLVAGPEQVVVEREQRRRGHRQSSASDSATLASE